MPTKTNTTRNRRRNVADKPTTAPTTAPATSAPSAADNATQRATQRAAQRSAARAIFEAFGGNPASVAVKPVAAYRAYSAALNTAKFGKPTERQAAALAIACIAAGQPIADGATFPRKFEHDGETFCLENGVSSRIANSGTFATYDAATESFTLKPGGAKLIAEQLGTKRTTLPSVKAFFA